MKFHYLCVDQQFDFYNSGYLLRMFYIGHYVLNCVNPILKFFNPVLAYDHVVIIQEDFIILWIS